MSVFGNSSPEMRAALQAATCSMVGEAIRQQANAQQATIDELAEKLESLGAAAEAGRQAKRPAAATATLASGGPRSSRARMRRGTTGVSSSGR